MSTLKSETSLNVFFFLCPKGGDMLESEYQAELIPRIIKRFGGPKICRVSINDPNLPGQQGIPDLTVYVGNMWGFLEVKASAKAKFRPNQQWWLDFWGHNTFSTVIYPEIEEEVLSALEQSLVCRE